VAVPLPSTASRHAAAVSAVEQGRVQEGLDGLLALVRAQVDPELLNDLAVASHLLGRHEDGAALLRAAHLVDPDRQDVAENLAALTVAARDWRAVPDVGGVDPKMWERAFPGMPNHGTMGEHCARYAFALSRVGGQDVLDLGCGTGYGAEMLTWSARRVRGFDLWEPGAAARPRWPGGAELHYGHDLCADPLPPADAATMFEVLEHLPEARTALETAFAAVDTLIASFPNPRFHGSHMNQWHVTDWTLEEFEREVLLAAAPRLPQLEHLHQPVGSTLLVPGRDPDASFWVLVARA